MNDSFNGGLVWKGEVMSKKFSIVKTIDVEKLRKQIETFRMETMEINPYVFMNFRTIREICNEAGVPVSTPPFTLENVLIGLFEGVKIFQDDSLKYGEVEIR